MISHFCQYRYTLAHEAAHYILHKQIITECNIQDLHQWKEYLINEFNAEWTIMERQADEYARALLIPSDLLREAVLPFVDKARTQNIELHDLGREAKKRLSLLLQSSFEVPSQDIYIRLEDEDLP